MNYEKSTVYWKCEGCGHRWEVSDTKRRRKCPKCRATKGVRKSGSSFISVSNVQIQFGTVEVKNAE